MAQVIEVTPQFRLAGDLGIRRLGFGAMRLPTKGFHGPPRDPDVGRAVLRRAVELGVDHIDTAAFYRSADGTVRANALIRDALHPYRPGLVIATKVGPVFGPDGPRQLPARDLRAAVEDNLRTLGLDRLDLVYLRIGKMEVPHGESVAERFEALAALREAGLIRHLGLSNVDLAQLDEASAIAPVMAVQNNFHVQKRADAACPRQPPPRPRESPEPRRRSGDHQPGQRPREPAGDVIRQRRRVRKMG